jgi:hypothetical protein
MKVAGLSWEPPVNPLDKWGQPQFLFTQAEFEGLLEEREGFCMECGQVHSGVQVDAVDEHCDYCKEGAVFGMESLKECKGIDFVEPDGKDWWDRG